MPKPLRPGEPSEIDPSEVDATLSSRDPRDPLWRHPMMPGSGGGMDEARQFFEERGYWPPGTPQRAHEDRRRRDYGAPPARQTGLHDTVDTFTVTLRQELLGLRIPMETLLSSSLGEDGIRYMAREAAYQIRAFVLREDEKPVTVREAKTVTVRVSTISAATWRDHWKLTYGHRWWARWYVRRHPARTVECPQSRHVRITAEFDLEKYRLYPLADRSVVRRLGEPVRFVTMPTTHFDWSQQ